jgi:CDP-6-deoxy-D-xylo-4-hexulose-3-dehydrase
MVFNNKEEMEKCKQKFKENNVEIRPIVGGSIPEQPFFKEFKTVDCPNARKIHKLGFYIPNNPELTNEEIDLMCSLIRGKE